MVLESFPIPCNSEQGCATAPDAKATSGKQDYAGDCQMTTIMSG